MKTLIAGISDILSPRFYDMLVNSINSMPPNIEPDFLLVTGNMVGKDHVCKYRRFYNALFGRLDCPIIACFGNSEQGRGKTEAAKKKSLNIIFLEDKSIILEIKGNAVE